MKVKLKTIERHVRKKKKNNNRILAELEDDVKHLWGTMTQRNINSTHIKYTKIKKSVHFKLNLK